MIYSIALIAILTMMLIFLITKNQQVRSHARELQGRIRQQSRAYKLINNASKILINTTQTTLIQKLQAAYKRGIISESDANILKHLLVEFNTLLDLCIHKGTTLEEALGYVNSQSEISVEDISNLMRTYPQDVRLAWSKNNAEGLIIAMTKISALFMPQAKTESPQELTGA